MASSATWKPTPYSVMELQFCLSLGIMGLQWAKHLRSSVKVTINDCNENSVTMIQENCHLNKMKVKLHTKEQDYDEAMGDGGENSDTIEVTKMDANVIMHLRSFDFM